MKLSKYFQIYEREREREVWVGVGVGVGVDVGGGGRPYNYRPHLLSIDISYVRGIKMIQEVKICLLFLSQRTN